MFNFISVLLNKPGKTIVTEEFKNIYDQLENTNNNFFITGNAGTGKSTLITYFRKNSDKKIAVLVPTGLAAINVRGQTIHSFFKFPPKLIQRNTIENIFNNNRIFKMVDTIVIDEASMVRADLLDGIDLFMRRFGRDKSMPFGGVQLILVGDLFQLPPVVTAAERGIIEHYYETPYFFSSHAYNQGDFVKLELTEIFRQSDEIFIALLNKVRYGDIVMRDFEILNSQVDPRFSLSKHKKSVTLTTTNAVAEDINNSELATLKAPEFKYIAEIKGDFKDNEYNIPVPLELRLRKGARVMFMKNGTLWVNGSLGEVHELDKDSVKIKLDATGKIVEVPKMEWEQIKYEFNERESKIDEKVIWTIKQYPLRLAWAITIHKSQGMTFDRVNIDYSRSPFAHGQTYVALSRCTSLKGITLSKEIYPNDVIVDDRIIEFARKKGF